MNKKQSEHIDQQFREAAENFNPPVPAEAWNKMESILDQEFSKDRRRFAGWYWPLLLLLLTGGAGVYMFLNPPAETLSRIPVESPSSQIKAADNDKTPTVNSQNQQVKRIRPTLESAQGPDLKISSETAATTRKKNNETTVISPELAKQKSESISRPASTQVPVPNAFANTPAKRNLQQQSGSTTKYKAPPSNGRRRETTGRQVPPRLRSKSDKNAYTDLLKEEKETGEAIDLGDTKGEDTKAEDTKAVTNNPKTLDNATTPADSIQKSSLNNPVAQTQAKDSLPPTRDKASVDNASRLYFTGSVFFETNTVERLAIGKGTFIYGIGVGYKVGPKVSIQTGFYASSKKYDAGSQDYYFKTGSYYDTVDMKKITADCFVYEIPVSLRYDFVQRSSANFYGVLGLSSYIMKRENYDYTYGYHNAWPQNLRTSKHEYTGNRHLFSVLSLSAGYEQKLSRAFSIQAEPYIKLPLAGIGNGKVHLYSTGMQLNMKFQPVKKVRLSSR